MHTSIPDHSQLVAAARNVVLREQIASISLLQRHLRIGYAYAQSLMAALELEGVVTGADTKGGRRLAAAHQEGLSSFRAWALGEFAGCDGGDPYGKTWVLGVEHGDSPSDGPGHDVADAGYPLSQQRTYRYNVQLFKLLAAIEGMPVTDWLAFAEREQPFVRGTQGYFKGNLFPYTCPSDEDWSEAAQRETGFSTKERYRAWCRNHRFEAIGQWIARAEPDLVIACGIGYRHDFAAVAFQRAPVKVLEHRLDLPGRATRFFSASHEGRLLVVLPHLSGSPLMYSHATLQEAGRYIATLRKGIPAP